MSGKADTTGMTCRNRKDCVNSVSESPVFVSSFPGGFLSLRFALGGLIFPENVAFYTESGFFSLWVLRGKIACYADLYS